MIEIPQTAPAIMAGLRKLNDYRHEAEDVPAYFVAMGESLISSSSL